MAGYELELAKMKQAEYRYQMDTDALAEEVRKLERPESSLWYRLRKLFTSKNDYRSRKHTRTSTLRHEH
ncbi:MAG: hypothetical protein HXX08_03590 [Chloroflexi bacterium]|uniref:Uncharacterized protein n=1 Tax=Candidatus Chlorohelix allophototropha TaxID=3003348 RepID=A0A8T7LZT0_9CHLR|nr:hypothetical protein [Chloroflexota bacterium]WJW66821.1 hypothetical protein OZ401_000066 [Chloroflexota bacterium L227-S17]